MMDGKGVYHNVWERARQETSGGAGKHNNYVIRERRLLTSGGAGRHNN